MSYRMYLDFNPLFGDKKYIDDFHTRIETMPQYEYIDGMYSYERLNGSEEKICMEVANDFPGITFYGYASEDTTTGSVYTRPVIFNKLNGLIFIGSKAYKSGCEYDLIMEGPMIRGYTMNDDYYNMCHLESPDFKKPAPQDEDEYGGYGIRDVTCKYCEYWHPEDNGLCEKLDRYTNENFGCNQCKYHKHDAARNPITPNQYTLLVQYDQESDTLHALFPDGSGTAVGYDEKRRDGIIVMRNMEQPRYIMAFHIPKLHQFIGDNKNEQ